jgi:hypothetical protein
MDIADVRQKYENDLLRLPNVNGVAIGEKAGKPVIKVFVTHKVPEFSLQPQEIVPKALDGFEANVEEIGPVTVL